MRKKGSKVAAAILLSAWPRWLPLSGSRAMDRVKQPRETSSALFLSRESCWPPTRVRGRHRSGVSFVRGPDGQLSPSAYPAGVLSARPVTCRQAPVGMTSSSPGETVATPMPRKPATDLQRMESVRGGMKGARPPPRTIPATPSPGQRMPASINGTSLSIEDGVTTPAPVLSAMPGIRYFFESTHCSTGMKPCR
jgi:hypothetical protein